MGASDGRDGEMTRRRHRSQECVQSTAGVQILVPSLTTCEILDKLCNFSGPQLSHP